MGVAAQLAVTLNQNLVGVLIGAAAALAGGVLTPWLTEPLRRRGAEERAVAQLTATALRLKTIADTPKAFTRTRRQRINLHFRTRRTEVIVDRLEERLLDAFTDLAQAHGELIVCGRRKIIDLSSPLLDAAGDVVSQAKEQPESQAVKDATYRLGQHRLRLLAAQRGWRPWRRRPRLFDNLEPT